MNDEITLKLKCSVDYIKKILENKNFKVIKKFLLDDTYYVPKSLELEKLNPRQILKKAILLRDITEYMPPEKTYKLCIKQKEIDEKGNIIRQNKIDCKILKLEEGKKFLEAINYKELMNIRENDVVYEKQGLEIAVKDIENGEKLIEIETNQRFETVEKLKEELNKLEIPIYKDNYFVKKAEIELEKILQGGCYI